jgi:DNA-directed RNA polymerase subunit RPC12/RpoP
MPKYFYICTNCDNKFIFYHGMNEQKNDCSTCGQSSVLKKTPSVFSCDIKKEDDKKVGEIVQNTIKEIYNELEQQKNELKDEYYKADE